MNLKTYEREKMSTKKETSARACDIAHWTMMDGVFFLYYYVERKELHFCKLFNNLTCRKLSGGFVFGIFTQSNSVFFFEFIVFMISELKIEIEIAI